MADPVPSSESTSFTISIDDTSPSILYSPFADTFAAPDISAGWNPSFTNSGFAASSGEIGQGTSVHATAADGASLSIRWNGTGISLYGDFSPLLSVSNPNSSATYSVSLDGIPTTNYAFSFAPSDVSMDVLASFTNLTYGDHVVELTMHNPTLVYNGTVLLQFDRAVLTGGLPSNSTNSGQLSSNSSSSVTTTELSDNTISYQGQWSFQPNLLPSQNTSFHTSTNIGDRALLTFNGTAITLAGLTTPLSGSYNVSIDDEAPLSFSARSSFNASAPTVLYYRTGLDPSVMHHLNVVNAGPVTDDSAGSFLALASVNVTGVEPSGVSPSGMVSNKSSGLPRGTIAAIAVCASIAFIVLLVLIGVYLHRRRSSSRRKRGFLENPRLNRLRRFSFMARSTRSQHGDVEKDPHEFIQEEDRRDEAGVVDISVMKPASEDEDEDGRDLNVRTVRRSGRLASQNSDGSFSIDLPQLPERGYLHVRGSQDESISLTPRDPSPLSPITFRTSRPRGPRDMHVSFSGHEREGSRGILLSDVQGLDDGLETLPPVETVSPLRVNFQDESQEEAETRRGGRNTSEGGTAIPQSLKIALFGHDPNAESATAPITTIADRHLSFLDMESSTSTSLKSSARSARQSATNSTRSSSRSRPDYSSTDYAILPPASRTSFALSMNIGGGPTSSRPSLSPNISLQPIPLPPIPTQQPTLTIPEDATTSFDRGSHQADPSDALPSPTDSLPLTVSDIHFRHSSYSTFSQPADSRRASAANRSSGSHRPPHPPLPTGVETRPFIVQKLLGMHGSAPSTPFASPTTPGFSAAGPSGSSVATPISPAFASMPARDTTGRTK